MLAHRPVPPLLVWHPPPSLLCSWCCNTPIIKRWVVNWDYVKRIFDEARIHKYTYTNYQLSALNIEYYNFGSIFDTTEFCSENVHVDAEEKTLDDTRATHYPKMSLSEAVNTYGVF
jgi:hypothetical protein